LEDVWWPKQNYSFRYLVASRHKVWQDIFTCLFFMGYRRKFFLEQNKLASYTYGEMKLSELFIAIVFIRKHQYGLNTWSFYFQ
jgi:hypothetical protein